MLLWCASVSLTEFSPFADCSLPMFPVACVVTPSTRGFHAWKKMYPKRGQTKASAPTFDAGVAHALRQWKFGINQCSWDVGTDEPLTHARYADGSIIDGQKMIKSFLMLERFVEELASVAFISNVKKGKKLTTETLESPGFMDVRGHVVDILR